MPEDFNPVANYKRTMEAEMAKWESEITVIDNTPDTQLSVEYKFKVIQQLQRVIANRKDELLGFDKLTHPIKY